METGTLSGAPTTIWSGTWSSSIDEGWATVLARSTPPSTVARREYEAARARMAVSGEQPMPITVGLLAFESPQAGAEQTLVRPASVRGG